MALDVIADIMVRHTLATTCSKQASQTDLIATEACNTRRLDSFVEAAVYKQL
jgi:hypothetical protein